MRCRDEILLRCAIAISLMGRETAMNDENPAATHEQRRTEMYAARDRFARSLGEVDPDVLAPLINPEFMGGPAWPDMRQAWSVIRRPGSILILSDGLSDPFPEVAEPNAGFGLEVLVESHDALPQDLQSSWLFDLANQVSQQCADHGGIREIVERLGVVSLELPMNHELPGMLNKNGMAGVLLGLAPPDIAQGFASPGGPVLVITAKLLWLSELQYIVTGGKAARSDLATRFQNDGSYHRSSLLRKPVI